MNDPRRREFGQVKPARNAEDETLGLTEDPVPQPEEDEDQGDDTDEPEPDKR